MRRPLAHHAVWRARACDELACDDDDLAWDDLVRDDFVWGDLFWDALPFAGGVCASCCSRSDRSRCMFLIAASCLAFSSRSATAISASRRWYF